MKNLKLIITTVILAIAVSSCDKEDFQGPQGPQGEKGEKGNANVNSFSLTVSSSDWTLYSNSLGGKDWVAQKYVSQITPSIISTGAVLVYLKRAYSNGGYYYVALPFSWVDTPTSTKTYGYSVSSYYLNIHVGDTDNSISGVGSYIFKVVIVDGNWLNTNPNINLNNYEEVNNVLSLGD